MTPIPFLYHCVSQMTNIKSDRSLFHWWNEHGHEALYMFNLKLWNTSAVTEKFAPDVKFTQPEFPLIKLDKFVHSHLNLFICLSFLFFPNQTFLLKPARKTIDFFFSFCKFCLRFILLRRSFPLRRLRGIPQLGLFLIIIMLSMAVSQEDQQEIWSRQKRKGGYKCVPIHSRPLNPFARIFTKMWGLQGSLEYSTYFHIYSTSKSFG